MANVGYATLQIIPSARGFSAALNSQVAPEMTAAGTSTGKKFGDSFGAQFKQMLGPLAVAVGGLAAANFIKGSISAASDLNETITKTQQIFGDTSTAILDWSKNSATAFGQSRQQALDAASTFAIFGKGAGLAGADLVGFSTKLTALAGDFSSFYNASPDEAITAIGAALRGESEPIRRFGVLLNDSVLKQEALKLGLISTTNAALTPQARALAAYQVILNQSKDAQGDFKRTADGVANSSRTVAARFADLKVIIGQALLPVVKVLLNGLGRLIQFIIAIPGPIKVFIGVFAATATAIFLVNKAIAATRLGLLALKATIMANPIGLLVTVVVSLAAALVYAYQKSETFRKIINGVFRAIAPVVGTVVGYVIGTLSSLVKAFTFTLRALLEQLAKLPKVGQFAQAALNGINSVTNGLDDLAANAKAATVSWANNLKDEVPKAAAEGSAAGAAALNATKGDWTLAGADLGNAVAAGAAAASTSSKAQTAVKTAAKNLASAIGGSFVKAVQGTTDQIKSAFDKIATATKTIANGKLVPIVAAAQKKIIELATKRDNLKQAFEDAKANLQDLKKNAADYVKSVTDAVTATGNIASARSFNGLLRNLTTSVAKATEFSDVINQLKAAGLNNTALQQLIEAGPAQGLTAAKALLSGGAAGIQSINQLQSQLEATGKSIGESVSDAVYSKSIKKAQDAVDVVAKSLTDTEDKIVGVAAALAKEIAKIGKIDAPAWLNDLIGVTKYTAGAAAKAPAPSGARQNTSGAAMNEKSSYITVNNYNPIAEKSSVTVSNTLTRLAILGLG